MNGCFCGGGFFGACFVAWSSDALGRKKTLWIATIVAIVGGALQGGAAHIGMFLAGRIIGGFSVGTYFSRVYGGTICFLFMLLTSSFRHPSGIDPGLPSRDRTSVNSRVPSRTAWYETNFVLLQARTAADFFIGVILVLGYSLAAWIGFASYYSSNKSFQWRFPLCVQILWPLGMLILTPLCPESPRWRKSHTEKQHISRQSDCLIASSVDE